MSPKGLFSPLSRFKSVDNESSSAGATHLEQLEPRQLLTAYVVDISADENDGVGVGTGTSLREAIVAANLNPGSDQITFASSVTSPIVLTGTYMSITDDVTITAAATQNITVDGNNATSLFAIGSQATTVTIDGVDMVNGSDIFNGGAIFSRGNLTIRNSTMTGHTGFNAGAIRNNFGQLLIENSTISNNSGLHAGGILNNGQLQIIDSVISGNSVGGRGGAIMNTGGTVSITNSTISNNSASLRGGGIYNAFAHTNADLTITGSTISGNHSGNGGGIANNGGTVDLDSSTISGNTTSGIGGGIQNYAGTLTLTNSTISGNQTTGSGAGGGISSSNFYFGGVYTISVVDMTNVTLVNNQANTAYGGGIWKSSGTLQMANSIIAGNQAGVNDSDITGTVALSSHNLIGHAGSSGGLIDGVNGNIVGNSGVGTINLASVLNTTLANHGGPTETHAILRTGLAFDAGSNAQATSAGLTQDQGGRQTRFFGTIDLGAYELTLSTLIIDNPVDEDDGDHSIGDLSLREGLKLASVNPLIDTLQVSSLITHYDLYTTLSYTGTQDLDIQGGGVRLKTLPGLEGTFDIFVSDSAGNLILQDMIIQDGLNGVTVNVPAGSLGDIRLTMANVLVQDNSQYGVYMNDTAFATDAGLHFQSFISQFARNGNGAATTFDGVRLDDRGLGNVRTDISFSAFVQNGGDGLEIEEQNDGLVEAYVDDSFFLQNGYFNLASPDDGLDVDEKGNGGAIVQITNTTFDNHADVGIDIGESGSGAFLVTLTDVISNYNTDDNVQINETGDGDLIVTIDNLTTNQSINGDGVDINEAGLGLLQVIAEDVISDGNTLTGMSLIENDLGSLFVQLDRISTQFNGADGVTVQEVGAGNLTGTTFNLTTVGNGGYGVKLLQDQLPGDTGAYLLYYLAFTNTLGPITTVDVVVTP